MNVMKSLMALLVILSLLITPASSGYQANISVKQIKQTELGQEWVFINRTMNESTSYTFNGLGITYYYINPTHDTITFEIFENGVRIKTVLLTPSSPTECLRGTCTGLPDSVPGDSVMLQMLGIRSIPATGVITRDISKTVLTPSNYSIISLNYTGINTSLQEIIENIPDVFNVTVISPNTTVVRNGTLYNFTPLQVLEYKVQPKPDPALLNKRYTITGTFRDADKSDGIIERSANITVISDDYYLMMKYDINKDNIINKNEALSATVDYFRTKTILLKDVIAIVTKYFAGTHIL